MDCDEQVQLQQEPTLYTSGLQQAQNGAVVMITNRTYSTMRLDRDHSWSGKPATNYFPKLISPRDFVSFTHLADGDYGSKGAVVYKGMNVKNMSCAWVLAWEAPAESTQFPNKVYVTCGAKGYIDKMNFDQILQNLDINGSEQSDSSHPATKISADATIHDLSSGKATANANFTASPY